MQSQRYIADTIVTCDANNNVYSPGAIDIEEGKIIWVGDLGAEEETDDEATDEWADEDAGAAKGRSTL